MGAIAKVETLRAVRLTLVLAVLMLVYGLGMTGVSQVLFHDQANGGLVARNGVVVGAKLIGQNFTDARYFWGRPSATLSDDGSKAQPYNAENSAGSNLAPSNQALIDRVRQQIADLRKANPTLTGDVPVDMVTTDFTGFDPDITEANALAQVDRVAAARNLDPAAVRRLVEDHVDGRILLIFGEPHVNVLMLNLALDEGRAT